jgi:hypothetical protein
MNECREREMRKPRGEGNGGRTGGGEVAGEAKGREIKIEHA